MRKTELKFFVLKDLSTTEIHTKVVSVLKVSALSYPTVHRWVIEFKRGRISVEDEQQKTLNKYITLVVMIQV